MKIDCRGDMGFAEAMVALMTVSVVLTMYIATVSVSIQASSDPLDGFDPECLDAEVADGELVQLFDDGVREYLNGSGVSGVRVCVTVPGRFLRGPDGGPLDDRTGFQAVYGDTGGDEYHRVYVRNIHADHGRTVVAVFGVTAWA